MGTKTRRRAAGLVAVTTSALEHARSGDERAFSELVEPFRRELLVYCYRILGSAQDAEDVLQESLLAAWRGLASFEGRASVRAWLYRIATNKCLNALRDAGRKPHRLRGTMDIPEPTRWIEPSWIQPYPDSLLEGLSESAPGPEAVYNSKESITLAFVAALQQLSPRQRAALILRDVLGFHAAEAAEVLETTEHAVNNALKRARAALGRHASTAADHSPVPDAEERALAQRFAGAFENDDIDGIVALLAADAKLSMPPEPLEYEGTGAIAAFFRARCSRAAGRGFRLVATRANGQPAFGCYLEDNHAAVARAHGIIVLTVAEGRISAVTRFLDNSVYPFFGLPRTLPIPPHPLA
jgi:RNA polymerase sigma-70 factor (TIGR02960 family)